MARWLRTVGLAAFGLAGAALLILAIGSQVGLDRERRHTRETAALPMVTPTSPDGLVRVPASGFEFRARVAGLSNSGPPLLLLHGFPETSAMWLPLIQAAAADGYRVVAFDQRGYSPGARPDGVEAYLLPELVGDVFAVADTMGFERFHLVGHDWGAVVGWLAVAQRPARIRSWSALSIPHSGVFIQAMKDDLPAYIDVFNIPWLADAIFTFNRLALIRKTIFSALPAGDEYLAVLSEPGALRSAIHWYRGIRPSIPLAAEIPLDILAPTLFIGGKQDYWPNRPERARQGELIHGDFVEIDLDAGHYLIEEEPEAVVEAIRAHLRRADAQGEGSEP